MKSYSLILFVSAFILMSSTVFAAAGDSGPLNRPDDPPPSYTPTIKSGGGVAPLSNVTNYYSSQTTDTTPVVNFNFNASSVPKCPLDPNAYTTTEASALSTTITASPVYPDIGSATNRTGTMATAPSGSNSTDQTQYTTTGSGQNLRYAAPPDQCTVTSRIICTDDPTPANSCKTSKVITQAVAAVCPDGYVQVGAYDMQPEVAYNTTAINPPFPIPDMATYNNYVDLGYTCTDTSYSASICVYSVAAYGYASMTYVGAFDPSVKKINYNDLASQWSDSPPLLTAGVGMFTSVDGGSTGNGGAGNCFGNRACSGSGSFCQLWSASPSDGQPGNYVKSAYENRGVAYSQRFTVNYSLKRCSLPVGPYFTRNSAPRSLVCARIKSQYDKMNK